MAIANPEVEFHLPEFISECVEMLNEHYEGRFSNLKVPDRDWETRLQDLQ